jgi:hypothetical protein
MMKSPGEDWVLSRQGEKLFVSLPLVNQVAVIDTRSWTVANYIDAGIKPTRLTIPNPNGVASVPVGRAVTQPFQG